ncbi:unnamed protein product, partial [Polarella glacialis]
INLYDVNHHLLKRATEPRKCSYVEFVGTTPEDQDPEWFVSHWWGEAVAHFLLILQVFALKRGGRLVFWVCAYCNNQHSLAGEVTRNPRETSFGRAMDNTRGMLMIIDWEATPFRRMWCAYEVSVAISSSEKTFDLATFIPQGNINSLSTTGKFNLSAVRMEQQQEEEQQRQLGDLQMVMELRREVPGRVALIADGFLPEDEELDETDVLFGRTAAKKKELREQAFPLRIAAAGLHMAIEDAEASVAADRCHILNCISGNPDLDSEPCCDHPAYDELNARFRNRFARVVLRKTIEQE